MKKLFKFLKDEEGIETIEWALMAGVFAVGMIAAIVLFRGAIEGIYTDISTALDNGIPG